MKVVARITELKGRAKPWRVRYYTQEGERKTAHFATKEQALNAADEFQRQYHFPSELSFTAQERLEFSRLKAFCQRRGISIASAVDIALEAAKKHKAAREKRLSEAIDEFITDCGRRNLRLSTIRYYRILLGQFSSYLDEGISCSAVSPTDIAGYLRGVSSVGHNRRVLSTFFRWCAEVGREYVANHPLAGVKLSMPRANKEAVRVITPENMEVFIRGIPAKMQAAVALMAFAGVRPHEIVPLGAGGKDGKGVVRWEDIDLRRKRITIRADVSKTRTERVLQGLPANLWAWLERVPEADRKGRVMPFGMTAFRRAKDRARRTPPTRGNKKDKSISGPPPMVEGKELFEMPPDVLRHSFASYGYHFLGIEPSVEILGHDYMVFKRHYKGVASVEDAKKYFSIFPK